MHLAERRKLTKDREGITHDVRIGGMKGYITANVQPDGTLGEIFIHGFGLHGSTTQGWTNAFAIMVSISAQHGTDFSMLARKFAHMKFEPNGQTDNPDIPHCESVPDYIFRWLAQHFGDAELLQELAAIEDEKADVRT